MVGYLQQAIAMLRTLILDVDVSTSIRSDSPGSPVSSAADVQDVGQTKDLFEAMAVLLSGGTFT